MKKIVLSLAALFAITFANAQEETSGGKGFSNGDMFLSGALGYSTTSTGDISESQFRIAPRIGFFVSNNIALGLELGYITTTSDETYEGPFGPQIYQVENNTFAIGGFGRYYATPANDFSIFGQLSIAYASSKTEISIAGVDSYKATGFDFGLAPGLSYFVSDNLALEATFGILSYTTAKPDFEGAESTDAFELGIDLNDINFGVSYKF
jgi:outer membrane protein